MKSFRTLYRYLNKLKTTLMLLGSILISSWLVNTSLYAEEIIGILGFSNPAKGFYVLGLKGNENENAICKSRYMIPDSETDLIALVKTPDNQKIKIIYSLQKIEDGGTREYCIVTDINLV